MPKTRMIAAFLLALPLFVFGSNYFLEFLQVPMINPESEGTKLLMAMRRGGLMSVIALSHVVVAVMLVVPKYRFLGALLQLPISLGILSFQATMQPEGLGPAIFMVVANILVLADKSRIHQLIST